MRHVGTTISIPAVSRCVEVDVYVYERKETCKRDEKRPVKETKRDL